MVNKIFRFGKEIKNETVSITTDTNGKKKNKKGIKVTYYCNPLVNFGKKVTRKRVKYFVTIFMFIKISYSYKNESQVRTV